MGHAHHEGQGDVAVKDYAWHTATVAAKVYDKRRRNGSEDWWFSNFAIKDRRVPAPKTYVRGDWAIDVSGVVYVKCIDESYDYTDERSAIRWLPLRDDMAQVIVYEVEP